MVGKTLAHYEILEPLGAGGMGDVYRARDTKLDRDVAIKVLPADFATDQDRLARFEREAKLLASLNHSNIAAIYGLEDEGDQRFIVMEVVEGETLATRIARSGRVDVDEALDIARQITEALEAAHENGVIHRDLKPANVMVTPEGKVKVLDFGLAKAYGADGSPSEISPDLSASPTMAAATRTGVIMGTAAYMSPEQARGKPVDKRGDIFAFGAVLYEMLTGSAAFGGETVTDVLASVVKEDPDWGSLPATTPAVVRLLLRRCLQKDAKQRLHHAADARIEIEDSLSGDTDAISAMLAAPAVVETTRGGIPWRRNVPIVIATAVAVALTTWWVARPPLPAPQSVKRFTIDLPEEASFAGSKFALSPDGRNLVYVGAPRGSERQWQARPDVGGADLLAPDRQLYVRRMDRLVVTAIPGTQLASRPFFPSEGEWVGFVADGNLKKVSLAGGDPIDLCRGCANVSTDSDWDPLADIIVFETEGSFWQIPTAGGEPELVAEPDAAKGETEYDRPDILPGGKAILFDIRHSAEGAEKMSIAVLDVESSAVKILEEGSRPRYVETGHVIYARGESLFAVPFDVDQLALTGEPTPVLQEVIVDRAGGARYDLAAGQFNLSRDGTFSYVSAGARAMGRPVWVSRDGSSRELLVVDFLERPMFPTLSPDAQQLALTVDNELWVYDLGDRPPVRLISTQEVWHSLWTPDGESLLYEGDGQMWWVPVEGGSQAPQRVMPGGDHDHPYSWTPDGRLIFARILSTPADYADLFTVAMNGSEDPQELLRTANNDGGNGAAMSPDGRWLAYLSDASGSRELFVKEWPDGVPVRISPDGASYVVWSRDSTELYYRRGYDMMAVAITLGDERPFGTPETLFTGDYALTLGDQPPSYDVHPDGRFLMIEQESSSAISINVILNWFEELKQRVPGGR